MIHNARRILDCLFLIAKHMYILISEKDITSAEVLARYHERLPDGRLITTPQELKTLGSIPECQIAATKAEVLAIIERQKAEGVTPPGREEETAEAAGTDTGAELPDNADGENAVENIGEPQGTDDGETEAAGDEAEEGEETVGETTQDNDDITESNEETTITEEQDYGNDAGTISI